MLFEHQAFWLAMAILTGDRAVHFVNSDVTQEPEPPVTLSSNHSELKIFHHGRVYAEVETQNETTGVKYCSLNIVYGFSRNWLPQGFPSFIPYPPRSPGEGSFG